MPGKVLIVDNIVTNRIVTKVKLAAANYQVAQAASGVAGLDAARRLRPDLILCSAQLPDMAVQDFIRDLRRDPKTAAMSLVVESLSRDGDQRHAILAAGADDVLLKPYDEQLLLARLRSLLRLHETTEDLTLREGAHRALGLSEPAQDFARPGRIALVAPSLDTAVTLRNQIKHHLPGQLCACALKGAMHQIGAKPPPDAIAMILTPDSGPAGLQLLADLRANADTRDAGILVLAEGKNAQRLAADALDRGAGDVITEGFGAAEIALRLGRQIARKQTIDRLRTDMRDGLRAALTDPLTGLFNRRHAMPRLQRIADAAARTGEDFAAMIIDVDHFKLINDRFGHAVGDTVLIQLADVLRTTVGDSDLLARIGGEEFLVVLPDTSRAAAQFAAKRICQTVRETAFAAPGRMRPLQVTVSIGVALRSDVTPERQSPAGQTAKALADTMLDRADNALFGAKALGRNQVTLSNARSAA